MICLKNIKKMEEWIEAMYVEAYPEPHDEDWGYIRLRLSDGERIDFKKASLGSSMVAEQALMALSRLDTVPESYQCMYY